MNELKNIKNLIHLFQNLILNKIPYIKTNPKKGQWLEYHGLGKLQWICSECSAEELNPENANFCYFCGTDMRESNKIKFKDKYKNGD